MSGTRLSGKRGRSALAAVISPAALAATAAPAGAQQTQVVGPWDGTNPFNCQLQDVGSGIDFPDPRADPLCELRSLGATKRALRRAAA